MSLQFIFGGSGCGKTYYLQHFITKEATMFPVRQYYYVVPEQFTMQTQKELIQLSSAKGIMNIDVQSFLRLAFRIFEETGNNNMPVLDDMGKTMILKKVLNNMEDQLEYFGGNIHKKGYVQEIKSFLSELYQYGVDEEKIDDMIKTADKHPLLARKLKDMKKIFQAFAKYMKDNYITSEEIMTVMADVVQQSKLLQDSVICLDGFTGFTPTQYQVIERLLCVAKKVYVTVTIDQNESVIKVGANHGLFHMSQCTIAKLRKIAQENRIEVCPDIWTGTKIEETRFAHAKELSALEQSIFHYPAKIYEENVENISIHMLKQPEDEVNFVAEKIRKLIQDKDCRYRDIAVLTGDLSVYGTLAGEVFDRVRIPCFVDQKKSILANPFVELIQSVIEIFLTNFKMEKVLTYEKNIFSAATQEQCDLLDNFLRATGIRGFKKWQEVWSVDRIFYGISKETAGELNHKLDEARFEVLEQLTDLYEKIGQGKHSVREYAQAICEWFEEEKMYHKIVELTEKFENENELSLAREYSQIYQIVLDVLNRLVELLGEEVMNLKEFKEILDTGFSEARIGLIPPGVDQVVIGDINRTRLSQIKHLFFLGMTDSNIPKSASQGGVISDSERFFLSEEEYELAPTVRENVYTEQFYLYLSLTKPSTHLYLTYCETGNDGKAQNPAYIIDRIQKLFPKLTLSIEATRKDDRYLLGNDMGKSYLIQGLRNQNYKEEKWQEIVSFYSKEEQRKKEWQQLLKASFYKEENTKLSQEASKLLYHEILTGSTSQFERYAACAFSYFMKYGLHLKERQEHQVAFFDIGNIVHEALDLYTRNMIQKKKNWEEISESEQHVLANQCINAVVEQYKNGLLYNTERDTYLINRLRRILLRTIWAISHQMASGKFTTVDSEFQFQIIENSTGEKIIDKTEKEESTKKEEDSENILRLIGRIDRVDEMAIGDTSYIKIIDYKTGHKTISLSDLYYGLQMQLMIYLKASETEKKENGCKVVIPAGVLYYNIDDPMIEGKADKEKIETAILKELRMDGLINEDDPILPALDQCFETESGELPLEKESNIIPAATNKKGQLKKTSKTVTTQDFEDLTEYTQKKLQTIRDEIMNGTITINPYRKNDASGETACQYCQYHSICRFDTKIKGNRYRVLDKLSDDDVMMRIRGGEQDE